MDGEHAACVTPHAAPAFLSFARMARAAVAVGAALALVAAPAGAQRGTRGTQSPSVRAELASVLLQSRRYDEAAREYRLLLRRSPRSAEYRLGLARALAWGNHPRQAETELRLYRAEHGTSAAVESLLRSVRDAYEPRAAEAAAWVAERSDYAPYRLALARALARERYASLAAAQYDTLLAAAPTAPLYRERAEAHLASGDVALADADLRASLAIRPSARSWIALGDLRRDAGNYDGARDAYGAAAALPGIAHADRRLLDARRAQLARDERPAALVPVVGADPGWAAASDFAADNQGVSYASTRIQRAFELDDGFTAAAAAELRRLGGATADLPGTTRPFVSTGGGAHGSLAWQSGHGIALFRAMATLGVVGQDGANGAMRDVGASALVALGPWQGALELADAPAYPSLLTVASLATPGESPLTERDVTATIAGPLGPIDAAASWQRSALSDGNLRLTGEGYARAPLDGPLAIVAHGSTLAFSRRSDRYWDPVSYVSAGLGPELGLRRARGLSAAVRLLPELARSREMVAPDSAFAPAPPARTELVTRAALQFGASGELTWRASGWELSAALGHGRGRAGSYRRTNGTIAVRLLR